MKKRRIYEKDYQRWHFQRMFNPIVNTFKKTYSLGSSLLTATVARVAAGWGANAEADATRARKATANFIFILFLIRAIS
jgi:hypothetical protein